eukprot:SAG11_NODE_82_length_17639_cov_6.427594_13_plen_95_part_01
MNIVELITNGQDIITTKIRRLIIVTHQNHGRPIKQLIFQANFLNQLTKPHNRSNQMIQVEGICRVLAHPSKSARDLPPPPPRPPEPSSVPLRVAA